MAGHRRGWHPHPSPSVVSGEDAPPVAVSAAGGALTNSARACSRFVSNLDHTPERPRRG